MFNYFLGFFRHKKEKKRAESIVKRNIGERLEFDDRDVLERTIFPYILAFHNPKKILDVGREPYQHFYNEFFKGRELWTLEKNPKRKKYGAKKHVIGDASKISEYFKEDYFDVVFMNGVFGWGLNKKEDIENSFNGVFKVLKNEGIFILGWNDLKDLTPIPLNELESLKKFKKYYFKPLKTSEYTCPGEGRHTYSFFKK
ncbi:methyltransferase domain-containing protein [Candidatus Woesearchaeota archaeon]|nr:methyltransferase domain-containing protein [Candidatus Woesearchaeota archaeon]